MKESTRMATQQDDRLDRRRFGAAWLQALMAATGATLLPGGAAVATATAAADANRPAAPALPGGADPELARRHADPRAELRDFLRLDGDLAGSLSPWLWHGAMIAVTPTDNPRVLFVCEGCETKKVIRRDDDTWELWSKVMTCFKDPQTLEILNGRDFDNPITGRTVKVVPNVIGSRSLMTVDAAGAIRMRPVDAPATPGVVLTSRWLRNGDTVQHSASRKLPDKRPIPLGEWSTATVSRDALLDDRLERVEAVFASTFIAPWQPFLDMAQVPGHAVWHAVGRKTRGFHEVSPEYLEQARRYIPDVLAWGA
jgi:Protein of unknown function (DUF1838)